MLLRVAIALIPTWIMAADWTFPFTPDCGMVNVKDYGAVGDGVADDTEAIRAAIKDTIDRARYRHNPFVYLPKGTYKVSGPVEGRVGGKGTWSAGWRSMMLLMGESRTGTVIKLADGAPGYDDPKKPKWVVACGSESDGKDNESGGGNRAFRHGFVNFTVDVGKDNPGAIAIDFIASNRGTVECVDLRAPEGSGATAIAMDRNWPGPAFIGDVRIEGFEVGLSLKGHYQYGMTIEGLTLRGQRKVGVYTDNNMLAMRRIDYEGAMPFYRGNKGSSFISLLDSRLVGSGTTEPALVSEGFVNLRRVEVSGFPLVLDDISKANRDLATPKTKEPISHDQGPTFAPDGKPKPLDLPIEDAPFIRPTDPKNWTPGGTTGASLQAAIDAGAEYIYIQGGLTLDQPLIVRNKVKLILGLSAHLKGLNDTVAVRIEDGPAKDVVFDQIYVDGTIENASSRGFTLRHGDLGGFIGSGQGGRSHIVDVIGKGYDIRPGHSFWARQLNAEFGNAPLFTNAGTSFILGFKMESSTRNDAKGETGTPSLVNKDGGKLELFAGLLYTLGSKKEHSPIVPAFTNTKGTIALSWRHNGIPDTWYRQILKIGDGEGEIFTRDQIKNNGLALLSDER